MSARLAEHASGGVPAAVVGELRAALDAASEGARRVCEIVKGLKTFSRIDDDAREPVDIRRAVALALTMGESSMRHRATLRRSLQPVPLVSASEARLGQVVLNLLVNAAQSLPEGGRAADHEIAVATFVDDEGRVVIEVRDTGTGIQPDVLGRIFEPFFTTKAVGAGTGLGLSICHGIVRGLGGHISVETKVGVGSTFRVSLPAASPAAPAQNVPVSAAPSLRGRVLVIDDEPMIGVSLRRILGAAHDVETFTRAEDALEHIRGGARFDVILCDVMMPSMTGMDAYDAVHALDSDQASRMVFLTGGAFTDRSRAFVDAHRVMNKPVAVKQIRELVAEFVARARSGRSGSAPRV